MGSDDEVTVDEADRRRPVDGSPEVLLLEALLSTQPKVFGIGFHKTATTSLANSLYTLGYHVTGYFGVEDIPDGITLEEYADGVVRVRDAAQDMPWPILYRHLDEQFPGSKFILTVRPTEEWIESVVKHFGRQSIPTQQMIYGVDNVTDHQDVYIERYERHNAEVQEYFVDRPSDLLVMDMTAGDDWRTLCPFLGFDVPQLPPVRKNDRSERARGRVWRRTERVLDTALRRVGMSLGSRRAIDARTAYHLGHVHCRRVEALVELSEQVDADRGRAAVVDVIGELMDWQRRWLIDVGAMTSDGSSTSNPVTNDDELRTRWSQLKLLTRRWVANLHDESVRSAVKQGGPSRGELLAELVDRGTATTDSVTKILSRHGIRLHPGSTLQLPQTAPRAR